MTHAPAHAQPGPAAPTRLFVSGHSLTDPPLAPMLSALATSLGSPLQWNMQSIPGSPIRARIEGAGPNHAYKHGANREGSNMDVLAEWRSPKTVTGGAYDTLLVTEQHGVMNALMWNDTVRTLRAVDRDFAQSSGSSRSTNTTTWFYEPWLGMLDMQAPTRWIEQERAASKVWACIAHAASTPGATPIRSVPAGSALAWLVEEAHQGKVDGLPAQSWPALMQELFVDDVHLRETGAYFMAAFLHAWMWQRSPEGGAHPASFDSKLATSLQRAAWRYAQIARAEKARHAGTPGSCRQALTADVAQQQWNYVRDHALAHGHPDGTHSRTKAWVDWLKRSVAWQWRMRRGVDHHPFGA